MSRVPNTTIIYALSLLLLANVAAWSQQGAVFTPAELDELLAPIALYPDPLLAQILPAATYPDQLNQASDLINAQGLPAVDARPWDVSVRSVAHYPSVLKMMVDSPDWTIAVGQAYVNQPDDVMKSIQHLRAKARLMGYLNSNSYETVAVNGGYISIVPAQAQYIYVPTYNPQVVYTRRSNFARDAIFFGAGLLIGAWLNNAIDWNHHRVYNHGWNGGGWIGRSRSYAQTNRSYYVGRPVTVNRNVRTHNISGYRRDLQRGVGTYRTPGLVAPGVTTRPTTRPGATRPGTARPGVRPGAGVAPGARPTEPRTTPNRPNVRPGVTVPQPTPGAGPRVPMTRPGTRPNTGVTHPSPVTRPNVPMARPVSKPNAGATPSQGYRYGQPRPTTRPQAGVTRPIPQARPNAPAVRSAPRGNAGMTHPAPVTGGNRAKTTGPSGKAGAGKGNQTDERK
jgi:hypothetical protein